jgi:hypothetical protein
MNHSTAAAELLSRETPPVLDGESSIVGRIL